VGGASRNDHGRNAPLVPNFIPPLAVNFAASQTFGPFICRYLWAVATHPDNKDDSVMGQLISGVR
jgi:hypothetical protein